jgi:sulfatase modifying factor 1
MRKFVIILIPLIAFLLLAFTSFAQNPEFKVKAFSHEQNSMLARMNTNLRLDDNDEACALIQVRTAETGLGFTANTGIVGTADWKNGDYWVYVSAGTRSLKIFKQGIKTIEYILETIPKSRETYLLELEVVRPEPNVVMLPVTIRFIPTDALLSIDGKAATISSVQNLALGQHSIRISKDGYQTLEKTIIVDERNVFFEWKIEKQPEVALQIESIPASASVYLDGIRLGESPVAAFYKAGKYTLRITKEGYFSIENQTLDVVPPLTRKSYTLEENVGYLSINTLVGATVYLNDEKVSNLKNIKLAPQLVKIRVTMPKAESMKEQVVLKRNDKLSLDIYPVVQTGSLQIAVTPFDAEIELIGDAGEKYNSVGMKIFEEIPIGNYTIKVSAINFTTASETINIKQGETLKKTINLAKLTSDYKTINARTTNIKGDIEMVFVKGGTFQMGSNDGRYNEKPIHSVTLGDFYIGKYEVTQKQWTEIMGSNPSRFKGDDLPVELISWKDVQEFIKKLNQKTGMNYRLPTEAEWEYAARGGNQSKGYTYSGSNTIDETTWYSVNSGRKTHPIGTKKANELGIYDMSGNIYEWCSDWFAYYKNSPQNNPQGASSGDARVNRGGSWYYGARYCRVTYRRKYSPGSSYINLGFRLTLSPL